MSASNTLMSIGEKISLLRAQIDTTESQLQSLKSQLQEVEQSAVERRPKDRPQDQTTSTATFTNPDASSEAHHVALHDPTTGHSTEERWPLTGEEYKRYGRQLILPQIGLPGQSQLRKARVLVVGIGGLGCPAVAYLAGAGVETIGLMDGDTVEISNLHRQIAHSTTRVGVSKVESACEYLRDLNPLVNLRKHCDHLMPETAIRIFEEYDLILDCTDHPTSRYLISDACVLTGRPLVSASALKAEGQLIALNNPPRPAGDNSGGPCYRCIFPKPPPADTITSCGEGGILGPVVGVMGVLQALEAIKVLTAIKSSNNDPPLSEEKSQDVPKPSLLIFSAYGDPQFRSIRMRSRSTKCVACSAQATISRRSLTSGSLNYTTFCGVRTAVDTLEPEHRISAKTFDSLSRAGHKVLIDTRDETQFGICSLQGSINIPWTGDAQAWARLAADKIAMQEADDCFIVCKLGNDSQLAASALMRYPDTKGLRVRDIQGGFRAWRDEVDQDWPDY